MRSVRWVVYGQQVGNTDTFEGWPPELFASTTGERINDIAQDWQPGSLFSMMQAPNDGKPAQCLRRFRSWLCSAGRRSPKFGAVPCDCEAMAGRYPQPLRIRVPNWAHKDGISPGVMWGRGSIVEGWTPGLFTSTTGEQINGMMRQREARTVRRYHFADVRKMIHPPNGQITGRCSTARNTSQINNGKLNESNNFRSFSDVLLRKTSNVSNKWPRMSLMKADEVSKVDAAGRGNTLGCSP